MPQHRDWPDKKESGRKEKAMLEWLKTILGDSYTEDIDKAVSEEIGKNFVSKGDFNTKNEELKTTKVLLDTANTTIQGYKDLDIEGIKQSAANWETKYNTDTKALQDQLEQTKYGYAVEQAVSGLKFSSESAKKAFVADLTDKKLTLENGALLGLEDFTKRYKEADPGAFAPETTPPTFTLGGTGAGSGNSGTQNPFQFNFTGVRATTTNGGK